MRKFIALTKERKANEERKEIKKGGTVKRRRKGRTFE